MRRVRLREWQPGGRIIRGALLVEAISERLQDHSPSAASAEAPIADAPPDQGPPGAGPPTIEDQPNWPRRQSRVSLTDCRGAHQGELGSRELPSPCPVLTDRRRLRKPPVLRPSSPMTNGSGAQTPKKEKAWRLSWLLGSVRHTGWPGRERGLGFGPEFLTGDGSTP